MVYTWFNHPATLLKLDLTNLPGSNGGDGGEIVAVFGKQNVFLPLPSASSIFTVEVNAIYFALIFATSSDKFYFIICLHSITCPLGNWKRKSQNPFCFSHYRNLFKFGGYGEKNHLPLDSRWREHSRRLGNERYPGWSSKLTVLFVVLILNHA